MGVYKRKTENGKWTTADLISAIEEVKKGRSVRSVGKLFNIPESTIRRRIKKKTNNAPHQGRKSCFTSSQEKLLADNVINLSDKFYGLTSMQFRKVAFQLAEKLKIKHNFNKTNQVAGKDWLNGFLKRNSNVSVRKPEATSINRIKGFNREEVGKFFTNLENLMEKYNFTPDRIVNMDETGITTVQVPENILAPKGKKRVGSLISWERGKITTVVCAMTASGKYVPPMFIFARGKNCHLLGRGAPCMSITECTKNGWINEDKFMIWLKHFASIMKPTDEEPILLILDNHVSHSTLQSYEFCKNNNIHLLSLPPHTSHRLRPLDVTFFGPLKRAYYRECDLYMKSNNFAKITPYDIAGIFNRAYVKVCSLDKAINGFQATGILPLNPDIFQNEDFAIESQESNLSSTQNPNPDIVPLVLEAELVVVEGVANADNVSPDILAELQILNESNNENDANATNEIVGDMSMEILREFMPEPSILSNSIEKQGGIQRQHSEILTTSPVREMLEKKTQKRAQKLQKAEEVKKRKEIRLIRKIQKEEENLKKKELRAEAKAKKAIENQKKKEIKANKSGRITKKKEVIPKIKIKKEFATRKMRTSLRI